MSEAVVRVTNPSGLHARPGALLVQEAKKFASDIRLRVGDRSADAKSIVSVLSLAVQAGTDVHISATGADAEDALTHLVQLIESGLGEGG